MNSYYNPEIAENPITSNVNNYTTEDGYGLAKSASYGVSTQVDVNQNSNSEPNNKYSVPLSFDDSTYKVGELEGEVLRLPGLLNFDSSKLRWNEEFQRLISKLHSPTSSLVQRMKALYQLGVLKENFTRTALFYAKIIINERFLPDHRKTIQPVNVGGVAGGSKYICEGILFKFAVDEKGLYGGDINAMKTAGHELKSAAAVFKLLEPSIHIPLMTVVTFKGFSLSAISLLPLSANSLLYGTNDGAITFSNKDQKIANRVHKIGEMLNLRKHIVYSDGSEVQETTLPADIGSPRNRWENLYGRFCKALATRTNKKARDYITITTSVKGSRLFRLLREELVRSSDLPLCSDAFTGFMRNDPNKDAINAEVSAAFDKLTSVIIPQFAQWLDTQGLDIHYSISSLLHKNGINLRHMGLVYLLLKNKEWKKVLMSEMVLRVGKATFQSLMRKSMNLIVVPYDDPFIRIFVDYFNLLLGSSDNAKLYWRYEIAESLKHSFFYLATPQGQKEALDSFGREHVQLGYIFTKLPDKVGVRLKPVVLQNCHQLIELEACITDEDVLGMSQSVSLSQKATLISEKNPEEASRLMAEVMSLLEGSCEPNSPFDAYMFFIVYMGALIYADKRFFREAFASNFIKAFFDNVKKKKIPKTFELMAVALRSLVATQIMLDRSEWTTSVAKVAVAKLREELLPLYAHCLLFGEGVDFHNDWNLDYNDLLKKVTGFTTYDFVNKVLLQEISQLPNLETINLKNGVTEIIKNLNKSNIKKATACSWDPELASLDNLKSLEFTNTFQSPSSKIKPIAARLSKLSMSFDELSEAKELLESCYSLANLETAIPKSISIKEFISIIPLTVKHLDVNVYSGSGTEALQALSRLPLTSLDIVLQNAAIEGWKSFFETHANLLALKTQHITEEDCLLNSKEFAKMLPSTLTSLIINHSDELTADIIELISQRAPNLQILSLASRSPLKLTGNLPQLTQFGLEADAIGNLLEFVSNSKNLTKLDVRRVKITDDELLKLSELCKNLVILGYESGLTTEDGLANFSSFPKLERIYFSSTINLTRKGLQYLVQAPSLFSIQLSVKNLSISTVERLDIDRIFFIYMFTSFFILGAFLSPIRYRETKIVRAYLPELLVKRLH